MLASCLAFLQPLYTVNYTWPPSCPSPLHISTSPKLRSPRYVLDLLKLGAHLDDTVSDQARVQAHCSPQGVLCARTRIEAHDEVVAIVVCRLELLRRLGEQKGAPVGDAAHDTLLIENDFTSCFGDSTQWFCVRRLRHWVDGEVQCRWWEVGFTLLLQRGGQAVPAPISTTPIAEQKKNSHIPLQSFHTALFVCALIAWRW